MNRRGFMRVMSALPLVSRMAVKEAVEGAAMNLSGGIESAGMVGQDVNYPRTAPSTGGKPIPYLSPEQIRQAMKIPAIRELARQAMAEAACQDPITYIDHDLAILRAVSLSAKKFIMRQRLVERRLDEMTKEHSSPWSTIMLAVSKHLGIDMHNPLGRIRNND